MKKDVFCFTGINFPATAILHLLRSMSTGIQKRLILLTLTCTLWMNLAFSQPIIKVKGSTDSVTVIKQVAQYLEHLDVQENIRISITFTPQMPKNYGGFTLCVNEADLKKDIDYMIIKVYLDSRQPKFLQRIMLAHEMVHVKQYAKRELIVNGKREVKWKGQKYYFSSADERNIPPWEHEAYRIDGRLIKQCKEQSEILLPISKTNAYVDHDLNEKQSLDFQRNY
jgi:hypothetical protein